MQITINQTEIEKAVKAYISNVIVLQPNAQVSVDLRAGRGPDGFSAIIEVTMTDDGAPVAAAPRTPFAAFASQQQTRPVSSAPAAPVTTVSEIRKQLAEEPADEPTLEEPDVSMSQENAAEDAAAGTVSTDEPKPANDGEPTDEAPAPKQRQSLFGGLKRPGASQG